jgi:hypothetical protein
MRDQVGTDLDSPATTPCIGEIGTIGFEARRHHDCLIAPVAAKAAGPSFDNRYVPYRLRVIAGFKSKLHTMMKKALWMRSRKGRFVK